MTRWSVAVEAEGDREIRLEEVVELADAVAASSGVASGVGTRGYGARLLVRAAGRAEAIERGRAAFAAAVRTAGLPEYAVVRVEAVSEDEDEQLVAGPLG